MDTKTLDLIIETYGIPQQVDMAIEECSELTKALLKYRRANAPDTSLVSNIAEEIADVEITVAQLKRIYNCEAEVEKQIDFKLNRQLKRIRSRNEDPCLNCGCWDSDREGCTCPSTDRWYACPLEPELSPEDFMTKEERNHASDEMR